MQSNFTSTQILKMPNAQPYKTASTPRFASRAAGISNALEASPNANTVKQANELFEQYKLQLRRIFSGKTSDDVVELKKVLADTHNATNRYHSGSGNFWFNSSLWEGLSIAAEAKNPDIIRVLLRHFNQEREKIDPQSKGQVKEFGEKYTKEASLALSLANAYRNMDIIRRLANNSRYSLPLEPILAEAVQKRRVDIIRELADVDPAISKQLLITAAKKHHDNHATRAFLESPLNQLTGKLLAPFQAALKSKKSNIVYTYLTKIPGLRPKDDTAARRMQRFLDVVHGNAHTNTDLQTAEKTLAETTLARVWRRLNETRTERNDLQNKKAEIIENRDYNQKRIDRLEETNQLHQAKIEILEANKSKGKTAQEIVKLKGSIAQNRRRIKSSQERIQKWVHVTPSPKRLNRTKEARQSKPFV